MVSLLCAYGQREMFLRWNQRGYFFTNLFVTSKDNFTDLRVVFGRGK
jgi:hypothetical protein